MTTSTTPKPRGIVFDAESVLATLARNKTQHRIVIKPQPEYDVQRGEWLLRSGRTEWHTNRQRRDVFGPDDKLLSREEYSMPVAEWLMGYSKHKPGDLLYVKEAYRLPEDLDKCTLKQVAARCERAGYPKLWSPVEYVADGTRADWDDLCHVVGRRRAATTMPYWAARLWLRVKEVRAERLQDITEADAVAEGCRQGPVPGCGKNNRWCHQSCQRHGECMYLSPASHSYAARWDAINAKRGYPWASNPWVWVLIFAVEDAPVISNPHLN